MKPPPFEYVRPVDLDGVLSALAQNSGETKILAGGQSLVPMMNLRLVSPKRVVDINRVTGLDRIARDGNRLLLSDTTSPSDESHGSGLWLWHGKAPLTRLQPASRAQQSLGPIFSAVQRGGWIALAGGMALILLAVMLHSTPPDTPAPADTAAAALEPVPSPADPRTMIPALPVNISGPRVEHPDIQLDQAQMPSAPAVPLPARGAEDQQAKKAAHHTSARAVRKTHAFAGRNSPFVIHGVLTPPEPTVWHDGGH